MHAFTVTKQYFILLQLLTQTQKNSLTSHYCSPIQITVQEESEKWKLKFLLYSPQMLCRGRSGVSLVSLWFSWKLQLLVDMRACMCVCESSAAAVLLLWLVDTALTSLPRGCTSVDWDVCRTAVLELLSDFSLKQVKSPPLTPTASSSLSLSSRCLSPSSSTCACLSSLLPRAGIF